MKFRYYYGSQAEQFSFVRIPRIILVEKEFQTLSIAAKMLYGVLLDRMNLSMKNRWLDEENRVYIIYPIDEIRETLGFSKKKAVDLLAELEKYGLLEKKRRGLGLPNILYVMNFLCSENEMCDELPESGSGDHEIPRSTDTDISRSAETDTSRSIENTTLEVSGQEPLKNKIDNSNTYTSYHSDRIVSGLNENDPMPKEKTEETDFMRFDGIGKRIRDEDRREGSVLVFPNETEHYRQLIRKNIAYDDLLTVHAEERELIKGIEGLIFETVLHKQEHIVIASNRYPAELVKSRFLKLNYRHIEYVLHCLQQNTTKVKNIRKYLLAALFNAPSTMDAYFQAEVNHDMQQYALARK